MVERLKKYDVYAYILFAYLFSIAMRYIWVYQFGSYDAFHWNNQLMINTNDGYYFATAVKDMLHGSNPDNQLLSVAINTYYGTIYSIYWAAKLLPFSLDTIILYAPAVVSSLIVIPIILIMRLYKLTFVGFLAALLASITWSFYNRTMVGYFDTDMYALVFPVFILYFVMQFARNSALLDMVISSVITSVYVVFYPQGYAAITAIYVAFILYGLLFIKEKRALYFSIAFMGISLIKVYFALKMAIFIALYFALKHDKAKEGKNPLYIALAGITLFVVAGDGYELILNKINWYTTTGVEHARLHFYDVAQTIREAGKIPFDTFANRISGSVISFFIAVVGYTLLVLRKKEFLLFLPLIAIGFFAYIGGLRFTVYAIPAMAIGAVYFFYFIIERAIVKEVPKYIALTLTTLALLYPNIAHIIDYKVPTVFNKEEVAVLDKLKHIASAKDYTLTWWDYGYPIWYYSNTNTLIDGGKHHHDNYIISKLLSSTSQMQSANLARLSVEEYVKNNLAYTPVANTIFSLKKIKDPTTLLDEMELSDFKLPKKTRDIYLYLPYRMLNIFPTVNVFSNLDLVSGEKNRRALFYVARNYKDDGKIIYLGNNIKLDKRTSELYLGTQKVRIGQFVVTAYDKQGKLQKNVKLIDMSSPIAVIYMKNYHTFLVLDTQMYNSTFIQMFVLENYDKELFEPVIMTPQVKVYKLKR